jgi:hypothetical protein
MSGRGLLLLVMAAAALGLAACEGDDPSEATLSTEQKIEQAGKKWARLFAAADPAACRYMTPPGCEHMSCDRLQTGGTIGSCTSPSWAYRRSFAGATVEEIAIRGERAGARFSNGEEVELSWVNGYAVGGVWWIERFGGNAGRRFFEARS